MNTVIGNRERSRRLGEGEPTANLVCSMASWLVWLFHLQIRQGSHGSFYQEISSFGSSVKWWGNEDPTYSIQSFYLHVIQVLEGHLWDHKLFLHPLPPTAKLVGNHHQLWAESGTCLPRGLLPMHLLMALFSNSPNKLLSKFPTFCLSRKSEEVIVLCDRVCFEAEELWCQGDKPWIVELENSAITGPASLSRDSIQGALAGRDILKYTRHPSSFFPPSFPPFTSTEMQKIIPEVINMMNDKSIQYNVKMQVINLLKTFGARWLNRRLPCFPATPSDIQKSF